MSGKSLSAWEVGFQVDQNKLWRCIYIECLFGRNHDGELKFGRNRQRNMLCTVLTKTL